MSNLAGSCFALACPAATYQMVCLHRNRIKLGKQSLAISVSDSYTLFCHTCFTEGSEIEVIRKVPVNFIVPEEAERLGLRSGVF